LTSQNSLETRHSASMAINAHQLHSRSRITAMQKVNEAVDNLDLRSLRLLRALLETRSVTKAGEALAISQPAASRVLAQLRQVLGDPLLVRSRHGNTLTPRAESLRPKLAQTMESLSSLLEQELFNPARSRLTIRIATTDHGASLFWRLWFNCSRRRRQGSHWKSHPGTRKHCSIWRQADSISHSTP